MELQKLSEWCYSIPQSERAGMRVPGIVYCDEGLLTLAQRDRALDQVVNVAFLPGIVKASMAMPDIHWGYGFPIGGVAATDPADGGVISPGGVGFDINCGVRLLRSGLELSDVEPRLEQLMHELSRTIPKGVGSRGKIKVSRQEMWRLMRKGAGWAIKSGFGWDEDAEFTEERGCLDGADPDRVSDRAMQRGLDQPGTLGSGNHFVEVQEVVEVFDEAAAAAFGLFPRQVTVMIHSGSRGVGHQICTDYIKKMEKATAKYGYHLPDRQLSCAPVDSPEGQDYLSAMACAVNYAFANRQCLMHWTRQAFEHVFGQGAEKLGMRLLYDVCHNIAKLEEHDIDGARARLCVHRKGATRAFGPGHSRVPRDYREVGQPVIIPGDMGTASYVLAGTEKAMQDTWGSTCHGAGRVMSRSQAKKQVRGDALQKELRQRGIIVMAGHMALLAEEAPQAYKDVNRVVEVCSRAGLSRLVARLRPLGVLKG